MVLIDGSQLFTAQAALTALADAHASGGQPARPGPAVTILYNPDLRRPTS